MQKSLINFKLRERSSFLSDAWCERDTARILYCSADDEKSPRCVIELTFISRYTKCEVEGASEVR